MSQHHLHPDSWVESYGDRLLRYALQRVPERDVARDLVQDTFVSALKSKAKYRGEISEKNWLFLILRSRIMDHFKKKKDLLASEISASDETTDAADDFFDDRGFWIKDKRPQDWSTSDTLQQKEFMQILTACMETLRDKQREAFAMKYIEGLETENVCKVLEVSSSNYWVLVHRAKLQLRNCLEKTWMK